MKKRNIILTITCIITTFNVSTEMELKSRRSTRTSETANETTRSLDIFRGVELLVEDEEVSFNIRIADFIGELFTAAENETDRAEASEMARGKGKMKPFKRIASMMMIAPIVMQIFSLPGAIASVKMSLLKSIMVAKLALAMLAFNAIRNLQNDETIIVHKTKHHDHYYHDYQQQPMDDEEGWFGR